MTATVEAASIGDQSAKSPTSDTVNPHRHLDPQSNCAVFDTDIAPAEAASWSGSCAGGLAAGHGTASFFSKDKNTETVSADFHDGLALDGNAEIRWPDGSHYEGDMLAGRRGGAGTLTNAQGDRFGGQWKDDRLNGHGSVVWANGDRYEGEWKDSKAEGHGVQVWADGHKYDGAWQNDLPNGQGTVTRKDGTQYAGLFVDGKRQDQTASNAPVAAPLPQPSVASNTAPQQFLDGVAGKTLTAVDGSTVTLAATEGGMVRAITAPDGTVRKLVFNFLSDKLGTISGAGDDPQVTGFFRLTQAGVEAEYGDGHSEVLASNASGGLSILLTAATGESVCMTWYPQGHAFNAEDRKEAVAAYARRLGVADAGMPAASRANCLAQPATAPGERHADIPVPRAKPAFTHVALQTSRFAVPATIQAAALDRGETATALQAVAVRDSQVHTIDGDGAPGPDASDAVTASVGATDEHIVSNCLKVESDGNYWGFRNHCGYSVQFAYCLLHGVDQITACGPPGGVPGSVAANGFGALFSDNSLAEENAEHDFRWVGCRGGAGEVVVHLDQAEPASGRCEHTATTMARAQ